MVSLPLLTLITVIIHVCVGEIIYEDGYTVNTIVDGYKIKVNPHSLAPLPDSHDLLLLDSAASVFYTLSSPLSQDSLMKRFSGNGKSGYSDGDASSTMFNKPKSFTVDLKGNVYVADRSNFAVRKINPSGVTSTIAGGYSKKPGRDDGPGRNATFSTDYDLTFVPEMCALLVVDHGHQLIRLITLKSEDCGTSKSGLGMSAVWAAALVVPCLLGLVTGFVARPYIMPQVSFASTISSQNYELRIFTSLLSKFCRQGGFSILIVSESWIYCQMKLGRRTLMGYFGTRNAVANQALSFLKQLITLVVSFVYLMFGFRRHGASRSNVSKDYVSLLDHDNSSSSESIISLKYANQLRDLIASDVDLQSCDVSNNILKQEDEVKNDEGGPRQIDDLMQANIANFTENAHKPTIVEGHFLGVSSVIKRRYTSSAELL